MAQKRKPDQKKLIADVALKLADTHGWNAVTLKKISDVSKIKSEDHFKDVFDILKLVLKNLEVDTAKAVKDNMGDNWRENLFEVLMARFDLVQPHRAGFKSLPDLFMHHPQAAPRFAKTFACTMKNMLDLAKVPHQKCKTPLQMTAFAGVYAAVVYAWMKDDTADMSKTMAAVDKRLEAFERIVELKSIGDLF